MSGNNNNSPFNLRSILEKDKLNGNNFLDWERNLRIVLRSEGREDVLETPIPVLTTTSTDAEKEAHKAVAERSVIVTCLMLAAMEPSLQKRFASLDAYSIIRQLKTMFQQQARIERYETHKAILECSLVEGKPVATHVFEMIGYFEAMERLGFPYSQELATDIILHSLHKGFNTFRLNFNMMRVSKTLAELMGCS
ncbi:uncharacterized protein LOC130589864 [Beta vulgaris subsp. vulgaris]|uniref:uncharacterized protein LOC130589864 n=1 Tax=Beta vulgaris subsp. vulgaris TaxID=3555 RepID=UPI0025475AAC|nr:uncharacterized protein LOC130589864 [Beta vulgaris subsp. vulgaris]